MSLKKLNILYCHGLGSSIDNRTGQALVKYFESKTNWNFERLEYRNPGSTDKVWRISEWKEDILNKINETECVIMATSAGAHAALNATKEKPQKVKGLFLFCPGTHLTFSYVDRLAPGALNLLRSGKKLIHPASRNGYPALVDYEGFKQYLDTCITNQPGSISMNCPVHIIHGTDDDTVPHDNSLKFMERLDAPEKSITLVDGGTHYLEFTSNVQNELDKFLKHMEKKMETKSKL